MSHELPSPLANDPDSKLPDLPELLIAIEKPLTQERVDQLKSILEKDTGKTLTNDDAWESARNLMRFGAVLLDFSIDQDRKAAGLPPREPKVGVPISIPEPSPPEPMPFPIRLDVDHRYEVESNLRMLEYELTRVKQFPSSWRWAVVAAYNALGHALAMRHPVLPRDPNHHLLELLDGLVERENARSDRRAAVERLELLRTTWIPLAVTQWPITPAELAGALVDCMGLVGEVASGTSVERSLKCLRDIFAMSKPSSVAP